MWCKSYLLLIGIILHTSAAQSIWFCQDDSECSSIQSGMVCRSGSCVCSAGYDIVQGSSCAPAAPYHVSPCVETSQCRALIVNFECRKTGDSNVGECHCQEGSHYFLGRCWKSMGMGEQCTRNEECMGTLRDPYNMACIDGVCGCANGFYERQRGECRAGSFNIGDDCILHEDCRFGNGYCDATTLKCVDSTALTPAPVDDNGLLMKGAAFKPEVTEGNNSSLSMTSVARNHGRACSSSQDCPNMFECTAYGYCACPRGYYANAAGTSCLAELGSPSTNNQCSGFIAAVQDGICRCPKNFYYNENMRDCVKATRRFTDACVNDEMCHTFGASARCGEPGQFELRSCECIPEEAVWDANRQICRLFAGIGEYCEVNSDCLAGNMEILCVHENSDESGETGDVAGGVCSCPDGFSNVGGLCLTTGLSLGDACQASIECVDTVHADCIEGFCSCREGFQAVDGTCAPLIGSICNSDYECVTGHSFCNLDSHTCECAQGYVGYDYVCWPHLIHPSAPCRVTAQCTVTTGAASSCEEGRCVCFEGYHLRDGHCWPKTGLFEPCSRSSECFLANITDRVQCRNSLCQCSFEFPYSEELGTCMSSATTSVGSLFMTVLALIYVKLNY
ncbi:unnamed protein product [Spodoptera littoralis]|uniref:EGF-like domain-containing protein n=1 Tax=Spodoptera littoralis TaxID=7109 RepID=A0A9P0N611_SPOLI|nr:unnamed protein product [Spodoptera littoralis]CAH1642784.1 unnamed protein product [Spodoptera littoralis]